jgi:hypothetical protein
MSMDDAKGPDAVPRLSRRNVFRIVVCVMSGRAMSGVVLRRVLCGLV